MSFDDHDRCRRCGDFDGPGHTGAACALVLSMRREVQAAHDAATRGAACGHGVVCAWLREAVGTTGSQFARREMEHPDTLTKVVRYVVSYRNGTQRVMRACPACGGNPNAEALQPR